MVSLCEDIGIRTSHGDADAPCAAPDLGADLEEFDPDGAACSFGKAGSGKRDASERGEPDIGHGGEPELIGAHGGCRRAVGKEV